MGLLGFVSLDWWVNVVIREGMLGCLVTGKS